MGRVDEFRQIGNARRSQYYDSARFIYTPENETGGAVVGVNHEKDEYNTHGFSHDEHGEPTLFAALPARTEVDYAFATPEHRHVVPTLLGLAVQHAQRTWGQTPEATSDLSPHSARLAQHFVDRGIIVNPTTGTHGSQVHATNEHGFDDAHSFVSNAQYAADMAGEPVPGPQVAMGRQFIRDMLRKPRAQVTKTGVGEQLDILKEKS